MHFSFKFGLILLIIQATLSLPVEKIDNNNVVNNSSESEYIDSYIGDTKKVKQNLFDDLTSLIEILNNTQQEVERINKTERVYYGDESGSQEFYEMSKSLLQKINRCIKRVLISTNEFKTNRSLIKADKINNEIILTLIDIAAESSYFQSPLNSYPMSSTLSDLIKDFNTIYDKFSGIYERFVYKYFYEEVKHHNGIWALHFYSFNETVGQAITDEINMALTHMIEKLNNSQQKIQNELKDKPEPHEYYDYNIFFTHMNEKIKNTQNTSESKTQVKGIIPELNDYIYKILNAAKQIQANINHTTFTGYFSYTYASNKINMLYDIIEYVLSGLSHEDSNDYLVKEVKGDLEMIYKNINDAAALINPKVSHIHYNYSDTVTLENVGSLVKKLFHF